MTTIRYQIILVIVIIITLGGLIFYMQQHTLRLYDLMQDVIASTVGSGQSYSDSQVIISKIPIKIEDITSKRYLYTLSRYIEGIIKENLQKNISLSPEYSSFTDVSREGDDFVFRIGSNDPIRIASSMYFFDLYNEPISSTISGEGNYQSRSTGSKMIALTFDDGPSPKYTNILLDILKKEGVKATFFVLGKNAEAYPKILKREYDEGHEIGNHSYSHVLFTKISDAQIQEEVYITDQAIYRAIGRYPSLFRPPYGGTNTGILDAIPMVFAMWSIDSRDWKTRSITRSIASVDTAQGGDIIIMHDIHEASVASIPTIISNLRSRGFTFVTVSEILDLDRDNTQIGKRCYKQGVCR